MSATHQLSGGVHAVAGFMKMRIAIFSRLSESVRAIHVAQGTQGSHRSCPQRGELSKVECAPSRPPTVRLPPSSVSDTVYAIKFGDIWSDGLRNEALTQQQTLSPCQCLPPTTLLHLQRNPRPHIATRNRGS